MHLAQTTQRRGSQCTVKQPDINRCGATQNVMRDQKVQVHRLQCTLDSVRLNHLVYAVIIHTHNKCTTLHTLYTHYSQHANIIQCASQIMR